MFHRRGRRNSHNSESPPSQRNGLTVQFDHDRARSRSRSLSPRHCVPEWTGKDREDRTTVKPLNIAMMEEGDQDERSVATSTSSSCSTNAENELTPDSPMDKQYSLTSNLFFLVGSSIQTVVSAWDLRDAMWDETHKDGPGETEEEYRLLYILNSMGPFLFVLNALVDAKWALTLPPDHPVPANNDRFYLLQEAWKKTTCTNTSTNADITEEEMEIQSVVNDKLWSMLVAVIFGMGALLEFSTALLEWKDEDSIMASNINVVAMHTYLISGLLHIFKERRLVMNPGGSTARRLMGCGMILFCAGSILDCIMSYLYDPALVPDDLFTPLSLEWCNMVSTLLWNVNAIFFVWADCLIYGVVSNFQHVIYIAGLWMAKRMDPPRPLPEREFPLELSLPLLHAQ